MKNIDISNMKLDNKFHNVNYLLNPNIFRLLSYHSNCYTDTSLAYIPTSFSKDDLFVPASESNNYADLSFIFSESQYPAYSNFKACRIKTFSAIPLDGNMLTYHPESMNDNTFIVFYSINPEEFNKVLIISTKAYNELAKFNYNIHFKYFDASYTNQVKKASGISDKEMLYVENINEYIESLRISQEYIKNMEIKRVKCMKTIELMVEYAKQHKRELISERTHIGSQYSAYNICTGEIRNFRDCNARNNFFNMIGIKLSTNDTISHNCTNMTNIVKGNSTDYRINLSNEGWIICSYISDHMKFMEFIQTLISIIHVHSKRISKKINDILSNGKAKIILATNVAKNKIKKVKINLQSKITYFRPFHLLSFVTLNHNEFKIFQYNQLAI